MELIVTIAFMAVPLAIVAIVVDAIAWKITLHREFKARCSVYDKES